MIPQNNYGDYPPEWDIKDPPCVDGAPWDQCGCEECTCQYHGNELTEIWENSIIGIGGVTKWGRCEECLIEDDEL